MLARRATNGNECRYRFFGIDSNRIFPVRRRSVENVERASRIPSTRSRVRDDRVGSTDYTYDLVEVSSRIRLSRVTTSQRSSATARGAIVNRESPYVSHCVCHRAATNASSIVEIVRAPTPSAIIDFRFVENLGTWSRNAPIRLVARIESERERNCTRRVPRGHGSTDRKEESDRMRVARMLVPSSNNACANRSRPPTTCFRFRCLALAFLEPSARVTVRSSPSSIYVCITRSFSIAKFDRVSRAPAADQRALQASSGESYRFRSAVCRLLFAPLAVC